MNKVSMLASAGITGVVAASVIAIPAYACHPQGNIVKEVQDQTTSGSVSDANNAASALSVTSGDTLLYTISISNKGAAASNGNNDMLNTMLTDTLPAGVELVSDPSQRAITENLGTITPGKTITKTYAVKVTSANDGDTIINKACYTGASKDNKANQNGCDEAVVKVTVPQDTTPTPTPTPTTPTPTPTTPVTTAVETTPASTETALPNTGSTALTATLFMSIAAGIGYAVNTLRLKFLRG